MFVDEAEIFVKSGAGGPGCVSFRREKYIPKGGPDGGDGGRGGDVVFQVDSEMNTLLVFAGKHHWIADDGQAGEGGNRSGRAGDDLVVRVPAGTIIHDRNKNLRIKDLTEPGQRVVLLRGGRKGKGNSRFATPTNQAPREFTPGGPGQERSLRLELKLIADVGLVGLPNAGKSTLLSRTTRARPKIADYPFTTLVPQLGIVSLSNHREYLVADLPGLIEGAHQGAGLGDAFLKHIERTRVILHLIDICPLEGQPQPLDAYRIIRGELERHSKVLASKPEIVVANKMDLTDSEDRLEELRAELPCEVLQISAVTGSGIDRLHDRVWDVVHDARATAAP